MSWTKTVYVPKDTPKNAVRDLIQNGKISGQNDNPAAVNSATVASGLAYDAIESGCLGKLGEVGFRISVSGHQDEQPGRSYFTISVESSIEV